MLFLLKSKAVKRNNVWNEDFNKNRQNFKFKGKDTVFVIKNYNFLEFT